MLLSAQRPAVREKKDEGIDDTTTYTYIRFSQLHAETASITHLISNIYILNIWPCVSELVFTYIGNTTPQDLVELLLE